VRERAWCVAAIAAAMAAGLATEPGRAAGSDRAAPKRPAAAPARAIAVMQASRLGRRSENPAYEDTTPPAPDPNPVTATVDLGRNPIAGDAPVFARMVIDVTSDGHASNCQPVRTSARPDLDRRACAILSARGGYPVRYEAPLKPTTNRIVYDVRWSKSGVSYPGWLSGPGLPINRTWPRIVWASHVLFVDNPDIAAAYPEAAFRDRTDKSATVSLDVFFSAAHGFTKCEIGVSSGSRDIDEAACAAASKLTLRYPAPCERCADDQPIPIKVLWRPNGGSVLRLPVAGPPPWLNDYNQVMASAQPPARQKPIFRWRDGAPTTLQFATFQKIAPPDPRIDLRIRVNDIGEITECLPARASLKPPTPEICQFLQETGTIVGLRDVFDTPVAGVTNISMNLRFPAQN